MFSSSSIISRANATFLPEETTVLERAVNFAQVNVNCKKKYGISSTHHNTQSKINLQRSVVARCLVEIAHEIGYEDFVAHILPLVKTELMNDSESEIRIHVLSHLGNLSGFLIQNDTDKGYELVTSNLIEMVKTILLKDNTDVEVKQAACDALILITSHIRFSDRSFIILPIILSLAHEPDNSFSRVLAVSSFRSGLCELFGRDLCSHYIIPQLCCLAEDPSIDVRSAAAMSFAIVIQSADPILGEHRLLTPYLKLTQDSQWNVRRASLESFVGIAVILSLSSRITYLIPVIRRLLKDDHSYVQLTAQRYLGPFLSTLQSPKYIPIDLLHHYLNLACLHDDHDDVIPSNVIPISTPVCNWGSILPNIHTEYTISRPPEFCAYSFVAVFSVVCGQGHKLSVLLKEMERHEHQRVSATERLISQLPLTNNDIILPITETNQCMDLLSLQLDSESEHVSQENTNTLVKDPRHTQLTVHCEALGGVHHWWDTFRTTLFALIHNQNEHSPLNIRKPLASSLASLALLLFDDAFLSSNQTIHMSPIQTQLHIKPCQFQSLVFKNHRDNDPYHTDSCQHKQYHYLNEPRSIQSLNIFTSSMASNQCSLITTQHQPISFMKSRIKEYQNNYNTHIATVLMNVPMTIQQDLLTTDLNHLKHHDSFDLGKNQYPILSNRTKQSVSFNTPSSHILLNNPLLQDMEQICQMLLTDPCLPVKITMIQQLSFILYYFPIHSRQSVFKQIVDIVIHYTPSHGQHSYSIKNKNISVSSTEQPLMNPVVNHPTHVVKLEPIQSTTTSSFLTTAFGFASALQVGHTATLANSGLKGLRNILRRAALPSHNTTSQPSSNLLLPPAPPVSPSQPQIGSGQLQQCWRLRLAIAKYFTDYLRLFDSNYIRDTFVPLYIQLCQDSVAVVRKTIASSAPFLIAQACPLLQMYFKHGGVVDCVSVQSKTDIIHLQQRARDSIIPTIVYEGLTQDIKDRISPYIYVCKSPKVSDQQYTSPFKKNSEFIYMKPPELLKGPEVDCIKLLLKTFSISPRYQDRITFIYMAESILQHSPKNLFEFFFLRPVVRLSIDPIRNVRWVWASIMRTHIDKAGRLGNNKLMIIAASNLLSSCSKHSPNIQFSLNDNHPHDSFQHEHMKDPIESTLSSIQSNNEETDDKITHSRVINLQHPVVQGVVERSDIMTLTFPNVSDTLSSAVLPRFERMGSSSVGTDAEIRRLLGTVTFLNPTDAIWTDGLDIDELIQHDININLLNTPLNINKIEIQSNHTRSSESYQDIIPLIQSEDCQIHDPTGIYTSDHHLQETHAPPSPLILNLSQTLSNNSDMTVHHHTNTDTMKEGPLTNDPAAHYVLNGTTTSHAGGITGRSAHFLIPKPKPVAKSPQFHIGVEGLHVDELDLDSYTS